MCDTVKGQDRVGQKFSCPVTSEESGDWWEHRPTDAVCPPLASWEVIFDPQVLFSGVNSMKSSFVFLILLLFLRAAQRPLTGVLTLPGHVSPIF